MSTRPAVVHSRSLAAKVAELRALVTEAGQVDWANRLRTKPRAMHAAVKFMEAIRAELGAVPDPEDMVELVPVLRTAAQLADERLQGASK